MLDISNAAPAWCFWARKLFASAGNPNKPILCPTTSPGIRQKQWCHLWQSYFRYLCPNLTFGIRWGSDRHDTVDRCLRLTRRTSTTKSSVILLVAFVEVWCCGNYFAVADWHIHDSSGLVTYHKPQFFTFIVNLAGVTFHGRVWCYIISANWYILHKFTGGL